MQGGNEFDDAGALNSLFRYYFLHQVEHRFDCPVRYGLACVLTGCRVFLPERWT